MIIMKIDAKYDLEFNIDIDNTNDDIINSFLEEMKKVQDKYIGQPMCESTILEMEYDITKIMSNPKYENISLSNNQCFNNEEWDLNKLLNEYKKYYPNRYENKKEYSRIEVNNMLFDLNLKKVIGKYRSPAVCADLPSYNNKLFDGTVTVEVPIFNFKKKMEVW